ncbi:hypothetical protein [Algoriphagus namhaensis]
MLKIVFFLIPLLFFGWSAQAQAPKISDSFLDLYQQQLPFFQELITGGEYGDLPRTIEGEPYYKTRNFDYGLLKINGIDYQEVPMLYDSYRDYLVTFHPLYRQKILMKAEKIDEFVLFETDRFKYFAGNEGYVHHRNGFYRVLHEGEIQLLKKYYKQLKVSKDMRSYLKILLEYEDLFFWYQGSFQKVGKKKAAIKALGMDKRTVKKEIPWSNYEYKQDPEKFLVLLIELREQTMADFNGFVQ